MTTRALNRNTLFYPVVFAGWALLLLCLHGGYRYRGEPLASAGFEKNGAGMSKLALLRNSITELQKNYLEEKNPEEKPHILQNIGCSYYDLYRELNDRTLLDSALYFTNQSIVESTHPNARFYYNFGRIFTELGDHARALQQYDLALQQDPNHVLALSNAGTCSYFAFGRRQESAKYFGRALAIDSLLPMCHLILGLIDLDEKDSAAGVRDFTGELRADSIALNKSGYPLQSANIRYASSLAHQNLVVLYSTRFRNRALAESHLQSYLALEPDPRKKEQADKDMKKYWTK